MSKSAGSTQTVASTSPPSFQQPYIDKLMQEASRLYGTAGPRYYPGSTVAPFTERGLTGQNLLLEGAGDINAFTKTQAYPAAQQLLKAYDVANNPFVQSYADAATQPIVKQLTEEVLPQIRTSAVGVGQYGGSKQQIGESQAVERTARAMGDTRAGIFNQAYGQGLQTAQNVLGMAPSLGGLSLIPGQVYSAVGEQEQNLDAARRAEEKARYDYTEALPYQKLAEYANAIAGSYGGTGTSEVKATGSTAGQTAAGGVAAGLTIWDVLRGLFGW